MDPRFSAPGKIRGKRDAAGRHAYLRVLNIYG
jgi:hypothetical protein